MKKSLLRLAFLLWMVVLIGSTSCNQSRKDQNASGAPGFATEDSTGVYILWSTGDREVGQQVVIAYILNARLNGWLQNITLMVWGPAVKSLATDKDLQANFKALRHTGIKMYIDKGSAENYGVLKEVSDLGAEVVYLGSRLSDCIKLHRTILTF